LAQNAAQALLTQRASIRLLDASSDRLELAASYGLSPRYKDKGPVDLSRDASAREALAGRPVNISEVRTNARLQYPEEIAAEGIRSILVLPILGRERALGILRVYGERPNQFSSTDGDFALTIARQGAVAIANALAHETLQRREAERALFVRQVTHELRAPVGAAQSLVRVLIGRVSAKLQATERDVLARVENRLHVLMDLVDDLLALAATQTPGLQPARERVDLEKVVREAISLSETQAAQKKITLQLVSPGGSAVVDATQDGLLRVFTNLVGNAVKYTPAHGLVRVWIVHEHGTYTVGVADSGIGIPAADMPPLWEEFFRASNVRRSGINGTGLGLSIVKRLVQGFQGHVRIQSTVDVGTTFSVILPQAPDPRA